MLQFTQNIPQIGPLKFPHRLHVIYNYIESRMDKMQAIMLIQR